MLKAFKARKIRTENNPSPGMIRKDSELREIWKPSMRMEFDRMEEKCMTQISAEEASSIKITPHVTDHRTKNSGEKKTRINAHGAYEIKSGMFPDKHENYSPAADAPLLMLCFSLAAYYRMSMCVSDAVQCFLNNKIEDARVKRDVVFRFDEFESGQKGGGYWRTNVIGYGHGDAGRQWYDQLVPYIVEIQKYSTSIYNQSLLYRREGKGLIYIAIATDDMPTFYTNNDDGRMMLKQLREGLDSKWKWKHEDELGQVIGITVTRMEDGAIFLRQEAEMRKIREEFFPNGAFVPVTLTATRQVELIKGERCMEPGPYRRKLGVLSHCAKTRHDIEPVLSKLAEVAHKPRREDFEPIEWAAALLCTTADVGLMFPAGPAEVDIDKPMPVRTATDMDWSTSATGHSQLAWMVSGLDDHLVKGRWPGAIIGKSQKEKGTISLDASTGEMKAAMKGVAETQPVVGMLQELAGVADENTIVFRPKGSAPPTVMQMSPQDEVARALAKQELEERATELLIDNASLGTLLRYDVTNKGKQLRKVQRWVNYLKTMVQQHVMRYTVVTSPNQPANGISKCIISPTQYWREAERVQGTQPAVTALQKLALHMAKGRRSQNKNREPKEEELPSDDEEESMEVVKAVEEDDDGEEHDAVTLANTVVNETRKGKYRDAYKAAMEQRKRNKRENKRRKKRRILIEEGLSSDEESDKTVRRGREKVVKERGDHDEVVSVHDSTESAMEEADEASDGSALKGSSVEESKRKSKSQRRNEQKKKKGCVRTRGRREDKKEGG